MTSIRHLRGMVNSVTRKKGFLMVFKFYCDESYNGNAKDPSLLTISGFFSDEPTWKIVEAEWKTINVKYAVKAFHAVHLNHRNKEFTGWSVEQQRGYSAELLDSVNRQKGRMRAYNCGIRGDFYRSIISEKSQIKMGHPWVACFQSCIAMIAKDMEQMPVEDKFSVVFGREPRFATWAHEAFGWLKQNPLFKYAERLGDCAPESPEQCVPLQIADLMAYEYYKRMVSDRERIPLKLIRKHNVYCERYFGEKTFLSLKQQIEETRCSPNQLVIIPSFSGEPDGDERGAGT